MTGNLDQSRAFVTLRNPAVAGRPKPLNRALQTTIKP
jgi:hypothetical protein